MKEVNGETFQSEVLDSSTDVVVDFWAPWCAPCKSMLPTLEKLNESVTVVKVNVDESPEIAVQYRVQSIPTLMLFRNGEVEKSVSGAMPLAKLKSTLGVQSIT